MTKKEKVKKLWVMSLILIMSIISGSSFVSAFGIGSAYYKENPLEISAGETKEIIFNLQNGPGPEDITARASITKGSEIMTIDSNDIFVPVGGSVDVKASVNIPIDAKIGDIYPVEIAFITVTKAGAGTFGFGSSVERSFNVVIVPTAEERARLAEQKPISSWIIYLIIGIVIIILIILAILFRLKKKKR